MAKRYGVVVRRLFTIVLVVAAAVAGLYYATRPSPLEVTAVTVTRGTVERTVASIASGTVKARSEARLAAESLGVVARVLVTEGQYVNAGDVLLEARHEDLDGQVALAEANCRAGQSRLEQARLGVSIQQDIADTRVRQTAAQLEQAQSDYDRAKALASRGALAPSDFDKVDLALRVARESAAAAVASSKEDAIRREEVRGAEAAVEQLAASVSVARAMREKAIVRAPFAGIVGDVLVDPGEGMTLGLPVVLLVNPEDLYVETPFDEADAGMIVQGQPARINIDAYHGVDFAGEVELIAPVVKTNLDRSRTLTVRIRVVEHPERFVSGMSADVTVLIDSKAGVVYAPSEALVRERYAYVVEGGRAVRRELKTGIGNWERTEVLEGLREGEVLITSVSVRGLADGAPVRVVDELKSE